MYHWYLGHLDKYSGVKRKREGYPITDRSTTSSNTLVNSSRDLMAASSSNLSLIILSTSLSLWSKASFFWTSRFRNDSKVFSVFTDCWIASLLDSIALKQWDIPIKADFKRLSYYYSWISWFSFLMRVMDLCTLSLNCSRWSWLTRPLKKYSNKH